MMGDLEDQRRELENERRALLEAREEARMNAREAADQSHALALAMESKRSSLASLEQALARMDTPAAPDRGAPCRDRRTARRRLRSRSPNWKPSARPISISACWSTSNWSRHVARWKIATPNSAGSNRNASGIEHGLTALRESLSREAPCRTGPAVARRAIGRGDHGIRPGTGDPAGRAGRRRRRRASGGSSWSSSARRSRDWNR